ncbi:MAG: hypothetical protein IJZ95_01815 [Oscillospiraceae bacterium]|nr:hypothetical protein [Oscillospiraceae bacterium]
MKKKLDNALNEVYDKYIEEAANADHLEHNTGRLIRNIAIPVGCAAAVAGLCLGLSQMGVFGGKQGVDLLPESSANSAQGTTSAVQQEEHDFKYPVINGEIEFPAVMPLVQRSQIEVESIIFGSQFPEMLYADNDTAVFTDGVCGIYRFDFASGQITFAADVAATLELYVEGFPGRSFGGDSWNGISLYSYGNGQQYMSITYDPGTVTTLGRGNTVTYYYNVNTEDLTLTRIDGFELMDIDVYGGLQDIPNISEAAALSTKAAYIAETDEIVYIRNCTADIDLSPLYNMQLIEIRRCKAEDITTNALDGGYYPFCGQMLDNVELQKLYVSYTEDGKCPVGPEIRFDKDGTFALDDIPHSGKFMLKGDIVKLSEVDTGFEWCYRVMEGGLYPLGAVGDSTGSEAAQEISAMTLYETETDFPESAIPEFTEGAWLAIENGIPVGYYVFNADGTTGSVISFEDGSSMEFLLGAGVTEDEQITIRYGNGDAIYVYNVADQTDNKIELEDLGGNMLVLEYVGEDSPSFFTDEELCDFAVEHYIRCGGDSSLEYEASVQSRDPDFFVTVNVTEKGSSLICAQFRLGRSKKAGINMPIGLDEIAVNDSTEVHPAPDTTKNNKCKIAEIGDGFIVVEAADYIHCNDNRYSNSEKYIFIIDPSGLNVGDVVSIVHTGEFADGEYPTATALAIGKVTERCLN